MEETIEQYLEGEVRDRTRERDQLAIALNNMTANALHAMQALKAEQERRRDTEREAISLQSSLERSQRGCAKLANRRQSDEDYTRFLKQKDSLTVTIDAAQAITSVEGLQDAFDRLRIACDNTNNIRPDAVYNAVNDLLDLVP